MSRPFFALFFFFLPLLQLKGQAQSTFIRGADISFLEQLEQNGVQFTNAEGAQQDLLPLLKAHGVNTIRLRLWHTPEAGRNDLPSTLTMAQRINEAGLDLLLDIHYSDTWADPGTQNKPQAWETLPFDVLQDSVYAYTFDTIKALVNQKTPPRIVQIGNEIIQGFLWNDGRVGGAFDTPVQWTKLASLLRTAKQAIIDAAPAMPIDIMIHIDRGGDLAGTTWFFDNLTSQDISFDLIGLSYYPWWHGPMDQMKETVAATVNRYGKPVVLVETAYPWTLAWFDDTNNIVGLPEHVLPEYMASPDGQHQFLHDVIETMQLTSPQGGVVYWAPEYVAVPGVGSPWENVALFDNTWQALPALQAFIPSGSVGIAKEPDTTRDIAFHLYPNPFTDHLTLDYTITIPTPITIEVTDLLGRTVHIPLSSVWHEPGPFNVQLHVPGLASGIYVIRVSSPGRLLFRSLLIRV